MSSHNIKRYRGTTVDECKKLCADHPECKSFEYGVNHGGSRTTYKAGDCQLNSGTNAKNCDGVDNNLDLYIQISCKHNGTYSLTTTHSEMIPSWDALPEKSWSELSSTDDKSDSDGLAHYSVLGFVVERKRNTVIQSRISRIITMATATFHSETKLTGVFVMQGNY